MEGDEAGVASRQREAESQHVVAEEAAGERYVGAIPEVGERRPDGVGAGQLRGQEAAEGGGPGRVQGLGRPDLAIFRGNAFQTWPFFAVTPSRPGIFSR